MGTLGEILLADADVLIDFIAVDKKVLGTISTHLGPLKVLSEVLTTVDGLTRRDCASLDIDIVETPTPLLLEAGRERGALSFEDRLNYLTCRDSHWTCVTNDGRLRRECEESGVATRRGLSLLVELARAEVLTTAQAQRKAQALARQNPRYINARVLSLFEAELAAAHPLT